MRYIISLQILLFSMLMIVSCSDSTPCGRPLLSLTMIDFSATELDTVIVRRLKRSDNSLIDTFLINAIQTGSQMGTGADSIRFFPVGANGAALMESDYNFEVAVPEAARLYTITDIEEEFNERKKGAFSCASDDLCLNRINSYKVNGTVVQAGPIYDHIIFLKK